VQRPAVTVTDHGQWHCGSDWSVDNWGTVSERRYLMSASTSTHVCEWWWCQSINSIVRDLKLSVGLNTLVPYMYKESQHQSHVELNFGSENMSCFSGLRNTGVLEMWSENPGDLLLFRESGRYKTPETPWGGDYRHKCMSSSLKGTAVCRPSGTFILDDV